MQLTPHQWQPPQPTVGPSHSHPNPRQRPASMNAAQWTGPQEAAPVIPFGNPNPIAYLVGQYNEALVIVDGERVTTLIDLGAQVSSIRPPVAHLCDTNYHIWGVTPGVLLSTNLPKEPECPLHRSPHWGNCGQGHSGQPGTASGPPDWDLRMVCIWPQKGWIQGELNLQGLEEWSEAEQKQARQLLLKWEHLFFHSNLDLGKTSLIKHKIKLMDQMLFKKHYWHIPPHMYDDVKAHLQEMLDTGAIRKSHSPWASTVVLVWKMEGSLMFVLTSGNWTTGFLTMPFHYPTLMRPSIVCRDPNGSPHSTWCLGTGRLTWMSRASYWPHLL